ncbi:MAG: CotH kinase family protein [Clostridium sp.]|nr:CotH kinase family protein [Clostridium sp.]
MSTHKYIDKICCVIIALSLIITLLFMNAQSFGIIKASRVKGYEDRLFDSSSVHNIDIIMDDWDKFLENCKNEEYVLCSVIIDNEAFKNVAIRAKGNTSLTQVENYDNNRYSFKIEFDHYDSTKSYYGLDKLSLNNIIQDNTYMKDFLTYQMMGEFGVPAPLCSYVNITVNGENWGLYLAVESIEEAFLEREYGNDYGELYKPDSMSMDNGRNDNEKLDDNQNEHPSGNNKPPMLDSEETSQIPNNNDNAPRPPSDGERPQIPNDNGNAPKPPNNGERPQAPNENGNIPRPPSDGENLEITEDRTFYIEGMKDNSRPNALKGSSDVSLIYSDDVFDSYKNIFDNAKTKITDADKERLIASLKQLNQGENIESVVNIDEVIRYFVVHNFVCNFDSYTGSIIHNYYLYEKEGQLSMLPWDYNLAFGGFEGAQDATALVNYPIDSPTSGGSIESRPMLSWIFSNDEYTELYHKYFAEFLSNFYDSKYLANLIDSVKEMISPYVENDVTKFCTYDEFETGIDTLKQFCLLRSESIAKQLEGIIPSTSEGQSDDNSSFVDASSLNISDMGTMHGKENTMGKPKIPNNDVSKFKELN